MITRKYPLAFVGLAIIGLTQTAALAQTSSALLLNAMPKDRRIDAEVSYSQFFKTEDEQGDHIDLKRIDVEGRFRLVPDFKADPRIGFRVNYVDIDSDSQVLPSQFVDTAFALGTGIAEFDNGFVAGITVGAGYASAGAFNDGNAFYGLGTLIVGKEYDKDTSFGFVLDFDGNRSILPDVPLPGFQYRTRIDTHLTLGAGFPFTAVTWEPDDKFRLELQWSIPQSFRIDADYKLTQRLSVFGALRDRTTAYHWNELANTHDRVFLNQKTAELGVRYTADDAVSVVLSGGYAWGQDLRVGWDTRDTEELVQFGDRPFLRGAVEIRW